MTVQGIVDYLRKTVVKSSTYVNRAGGKGNYFLISAVLDKKNRIISIGVNNIFKTHPKMLFYSNKTVKEKLFLHAEIAALIRAPFGSAKSIIVIRVNRRGTLAMARPCPVCQAAIIDSGIQNVYYSNHDGEIVYTGGETMFS